MNKFLTLSFISLYSVLGLANPTTESLNASLNETLTEVISYFDFMDSAQISIDEEYTNLEKGLIKISAVAETGPLAVNNGNPIFLIAQGFTEVTEVNDQKFFNINFGVGLDVAVMPLLKNIQSSFGDCELVEVDEQTTSEEHNANIMCIVLTGFKTSEKVSDLQYPINKAVEYSKAAYGDTNPELGQILKNLSLVVSEEGSLFLSSNLNIDGKLSANVILSIKEDSLDLVVEGSLAVEDEKLNKYIALVSEKATELIDRESPTHGVYEDNLFLIMGILESFFTTAE